MEISPLQQARYAYRPKLPRVFSECGAAVEAVEGAPTSPASDEDAIRALFPHTYGLPRVTFKPAPGKAFAPIRAGVILSGGQAPGGHNVIAGLFDGLKSANPKSELFGFLGGPSGLLEDRCKLLDDSTIGDYRNTGGFDIIGSGRTKLEDESHFAKVVKHCAARGISALVIVGGDDSNTNACFLAEYCRKTGAGIQVIGCPKTIDGDLKSEQIEISFGFDTATKVYGEQIGNILRDARSARKYWHFIKLMGRSASHITLECVLNTHPNVALISEEIQATGRTLRQIVEEIADVVRKRAETGRNFGVVLVPEGLIEFIPEMKRLIAELNDRMADPAFKACKKDDDRFQFINRHLSAESSQAFSCLPHEIQLQLMMDRDPHGNVQVSRIETEQLLVDMVGDLLAEWKANGKYRGKFSAQCHFFGYEGRCAAPSNFDADYGYSLGTAAAALVCAGKTGYIASVGSLVKPAAEWVPGGLPLTMLMNLERRHGSQKPVIRKALVDLNGKPFKKFSELRGTWAVESAYLYPGPIQYFGPTEVCDLPTATLRLERG
ncbi:MAG: diphosphate--fructose-6-phosphate 1-phosphotransferase [Planctomycetota bacterium]